MTNVLGHIAPMYVAPADWTLASVYLSDSLPLILRTGTYVADQTTLDNVVAAQISASLPLVYLNIPPMGFSDARLSNPNAYYPTPALLAEIIASAAGLTVEFGAAQGLVDDYVAAAMEAHTPGIELGYAEVTSSFVSATSATVTGLSVTVTGQGRAVDIEAYIPRAYHATNGALIEAVIMWGATPIQSDATASYNTATGRALNPRRRLVLTDGVSYTFTVTFSRDIAGNTTLYATAGRAMWLSVVSR